MASKKGPPMEECAGAETSTIDLANLPGQIHALREELQAKREERERVERAPVPLEEAYQGLERAVDRMGEYGCSRLEQFVGRMLHPQNAAHVPLLGEVGSGGSLRQAEAVVAYVFREHLLSLGRSILEGKYESAGVAIPYGDRPRILADLEAEVFALEVKEESLIEQAERLGLAIPRRHDAAPEAVLGIPRGASLPWDWTSEKYDRILLAKESARAEIESIRAALKEANRHLMDAEIYANRADDNTVMSANAKKQARRELEVAQAKANKWRRKMADAHEIVRERVALATSLEAWVRENTQRPPAVCQGRPEPSPSSVQFEQPIRPSWRPE